MSKHRNFSPESKRDAVELTRMEGVAIRQFAKNPGIGSTIQV